MSQAVPTMHNLFGNDSTDDWLDLPATDLEFEQLLAGSTNFEYPDSPTNTDSYFNSEENSQFMPPNPNEVKSEIKIEKNELQPHMNNNNEYTNDVYKTEIKTELSNSNQSPFQDVNSEMIKNERILNLQMNPIMQQQAINQISPQQMTQQGNNTMSQQINPQQINLQQLNQQQVNQKLINQNNQMAGIPADQLHRVATSFSLSSRRKNVPVARPPQNQMNVPPQAQPQNPQSNFIQHSPVYSNPPENSIYFSQNTPPPGSSNYLMQNAQPQPPRVTVQPSVMGMGIQNENFMLSNRIQGPIQPQNQHQIHQNVSFNPQNSQANPNLINQPMGGPPPPQNIQQPPPSFSYNSINSQNTPLPPQNTPVVPMMNNNNQVNHNNHQMDISVPPGVPTNTSIGSLSTNIPPAAVNQQLSTDGRSYPIFPGSTPNNRPITRIQQNSAPILVNSHQNIPNTIQNPINNSLSQSLNPTALHTSTTLQSVIGQSQSSGNVPLQSMNLMQNNVSQHQIAPPPGSAVMMPQGTSRNSNLLPQSSPIQSNSGQIMLNHSGNSQAIPSPNVHYTKTNVPTNSNLPGQVMASNIITGNSGNVPSQQISNFSGRTYHNNPPEISNNNQISFSRFPVDASITNTSLSSSNSNPNIMAPPVALPPSNAHLVHPEQSGNNQINIIANRNQPPHSMISTPSYHQNQQSSCLISHNYQTPYSRAQSSFLYENLTYSSNDSFTTRYQSQTAPAYQSPYFQQNSEMDHLLPNFLHSTPVSQ